MDQKSTLLALASDSHKLKQMIIDSDGEITPDLENALIVNEQMLMEKADSYKFIMDDLSKFAEILKEKENQIKRARQSIENAVDRLKYNIKHAMLLMDNQKIMGKDYVFTLKNSKPSLVITDENQVPSDFKRQIITLEVDKEKIMAELKLTGHVDGVELKENKSLTITINKG